VQAFDAAHPLWPAYVAHLVRVGMARGEALDTQGEPKPRCHYLGAVRGDQVIAHIAIQEQALVVPATAWSGGSATPLAGADGHGLRETFVRAFAVEEAHRRQGYGRALQLAALARTRALGCYQMRSWSSLDKPANYALKLALGFAVHPAISVTPRGQEISGVYFVKTV
jgi:GNAT superfamily N-acetyltransferase